MEKILEVAGDYANYVASALLLDIGLDNYSERIYNNLVIFFLISLFINHYLSNKISPHGSNADATNVIISKVATLRVYEVFLLIPISRLVMTFSSEVEHGPLSLQSFVNAVLAISIILLLLNPILEKMADVASSIYQLGSNMSFIWRILHYPLRITIVMFTVYLFGMLPLMYRAHMLEVYTILSGEEAAIVTLCTFFLSVGWTFIDPWVRRILTQSGSGLEEPRPSEGEVRTHWQPAAGNKGGQPEGPTTTPMPPMNVGDFRGWAAQQSGKWEPVDGCPRAIMPDSATHSAIKARAVFLIERHLEATDSRCRSIILTLALPASNKRRNARMPDLAVICSPPDADECEGLDPLFLLNVLSPTNEQDSRGNVWPYMSIRTVEQILLVDPTAVRGEMLRRDPDGAWPKQPESLGPDDDVRVDAIGFSCRLRDFYDRTRLAV